MLPFDNVTVTKDAGQLGSIKPTKQPAAMARRDWCHSKNRRTGKDTLAEAETGAIR